MKLANVKAVSACLTDSGIATSKHTLPNIYTVMYKYVAVYMCVCFFYNLPQSFSLQKVLAGICLNLYKFCQK